MTNDTPSRRKYPRLPATNALLVQLLGDTMDEELARTRNISAGGCMFTSPKSFRVGAAIQLLIKIGDDVLEAVARVVYTIPGASGDHDIGAEFIFIQEAHRKKILDLLKN